MSDSAAPEIEQTKGPEDPNQSLPSNPNQDGVDGESDGFGSAAPTVLKPKPNTRLAPGLPSSTTAQNLPGAFFILTVTPSQKSGAGGKPEFPGRFNALAYDPFWNDTDTKEVVAQRYATKPPYIENLTDRGQSESTFEIDDKRSAISGVFGDNKPGFSKSEWPWDKPVVLTLSFQGFRRNWQQGQRVGSAWTSGTADPVAIKKESFRPITKRDQSWKFADFVMEADGNTDHSYRVEYFTKSPEQSKSG